MIRRCKRVLLILALASACDLNPQPLPPGSQGFSGGAPTATPVADGGTALGGGAYEDARATDAEPQQGTTSGTVDGGASNGEGADASTGDGAPADAESGSESGTSSDAGDGGSDSDLDGSAVDASLEASPNHR